MKSAVKKRRAKSICSANAIAPGRTRSPRLRAVVSYINDNREVVLEHTAMEIATATQTSDATVVRAIQALGFAGLRELKQTMERWFGTSVTSAEKMRSTVTALSSDVNSSIDFVLEGHQRVCEVLSRADNRAAVAPGGGIAQRRAPGGDLRYRRLGDPRRIHRPVVQPYWPAGVRDEPHRALALPNSLSACSAAMC